MTTSGTMLDLNYDVKKAYNASIFTGTIITINHVNQTAVLEMTYSDNPHLVSSTAPGGGQEVRTDTHARVRLQNIPIHYHCPSYRSTPFEPLKGGSSAFRNGDSVLVMYYGIKNTPSSSNLVIFGFKTGPRACVPDGILVIKDPTSKKLVMYDCINNRPYVLYDSVTGNELPQPYTETQLQQAFSGVVKLVPEVNYPNGFADNMSLAGLVWESYTYSNPVNVFSGYSIGYDTTIRPPEKRSRGGLLKDEQIKHPTMKWPDNLPQDAKYLERMGWHIYERDYMPAYKWEECQQSFAFYLKEKPEVVPTGPYPIPGQTPPKEKWYYRYQPNQVPITRDGIKFPQQKYYSSNKYSLFYHPQYMFTNGRGGSYPSPQPTPTPIEAPDTTGFLALLNAKRLAKGFGAVKWDPRYSKIIKAHCKAQIEQGFQGHNSPTGSTPNQRAMEGGYLDYMGEVLVHSEILYPDGDVYNATTHQYGDWRSLIGIRAGFAYSHPDFWKIVLDAWMGSPRHYAVLMTAKAKYVGFAVEYKPGDTMRWECGCIMRGDKLPGSEYNFNTVPDNIGGGYLLSWWGYDGLSGPGYSNPVVGMPFGLPNIDYTYKDLVIPCSGERRAFWMWIDKGVYLNDTASMPKITIHYWDNSEQVIPAPPLPCQWKLWPWLGAFVKGKVALMIEHVWQENRNWKGLYSVGNSTYNRFLKLHVMANGTYNDRNGKYTYNWSEVVEIDTSWILQKLKVDNTTQDSQLQFYYLSDTELDYMLLPSAKPGMWCSKDGQLACVPQVILNPDTGLPVQEPVKITFKLAPDDKVGLLFYTTDGTAPVENVSQWVKGSLELQLYNPTTVKVLPVTGDCIKGDVKSWSFTRVSV